MSGRGAHEIGSVDMDGGRMAVLTKMGTDNLLPAYSPGGGEIAFTSYARNNPDLWIVSAGGGRARRVSKQPGLNTGAAWSPDGRAIALTLSHEGNSEIYRISPDDGRVLARLTQTPAIDSSPSFSPDGSQIAFVSNRQGSPQIFVMPATGGAAKRVTFQGKYNQTPRFSPRTDKPQIAFTGRDEKGVFDVFILDLKTNRIDRVVLAGQGIEPGPDLVARWAPAGLHLDPRRHLRLQPGDASRGPGLEGERILPLLGPRPAPLVAPPERAAMTRASGIARLRAGAMRLACRDGHRSGLWNGNRGSAGPRDDRVRRPAVLLLLRVVS